MTFVGLCMATALASGLGCGDTRRPPNVIVVVIDTLRQDHVGCYGYPADTTPNIDALAEIGVRFDNAYSQAPWTTPSFATMLTSHYPTTHGVVRKPDRLDDRFVLLPEVLSEHGYATGAVISHYFLKSKWNLCQGFKVYDESCILGHGGVSSPHVTRTSLDLVDRFAAGPFFLLVHYFDPHYDYIEHEEFLNTADLGYDGPITSGMVYTELLDMVEELTETDLAYLRRVYDSEIAFTDAHIGTLLEGLEDRGLFEDSLIIVTADHGEEFRERRTIGHGHSLYNELIKVPLIIKLPRSRQTGPIDANVGLVDLYPTILDLLEIPFDHEIAGVSMVNDDGVLDPRPAPVYSETEWGRYRAVINGHTKLIRRLEPSRIWAFDLASDAGERKGPLDPRRPETWGDTARSLDRLLEAWMKRVATAKVAAASVEVTDEEREQLEALGYLDN
jgi:arylsulfatase A-like enzyme